MSNDTIAQRKARAIEKLTNDRDSAIKRAEVAEAKIKELEDRDQRFSMREPTALRDQLSKAEARAAQLQTDNDEMQSYINEIRVALHTEKDELTIDAVRRVISERDTAWSELREIREAIHADENEATSDEVRRVVAELARKLETAQHEIERLTRFLQTIFNLGDKSHAAFDGERHRQMRHCANQALNTKREYYEP